MFTGIIEELGQLNSASRRETTTRFDFAARVVTSGVRIGDSIAVNGCCLTVIDHGTTSFAVEAVDETLTRTNLGELKAGEKVNLERAAVIGDRLGGHLVQGHIDGVGVIEESAPHLCIAIPPELSPYVSEKGSIAVDGCSLTIVEALPEQVRIEIIPYTSAVTTLGNKQRGTLVNLEIDVVARYVARLISVGVRVPPHTLRDIG